MVAAAPQRNDTHMETTLSIRTVGNYTHQQVGPEACSICGDAEYGDVIINGVCADCILQACTYAAQTLRNLGNGFLAGEARTIALNEAANLERVSLEKRKWTQHKKDS